MPMKPSESETLAEVISSVLFLAVIAFILFVS